MPLFRALLVACVVALAPLAARAADAPAIAAAADLKFALSELADQFRRDSGREVKLAFGSSGNFKHQIEHGAPFEMFLSADEAYVFQLADRGLTRDRGTLYAVGRLALFAPHGSPLAVDSDLSGLRAAVAGSGIRRFAIANPDHAPYGRAARAVLRHLGVWAAIESRLVFGENAAQAMQFAASGSSQGGIVPLSLSKPPEVAKLGTFAVIPAEWHAEEPLRQRMVLVRSAGSTAQGFYDFLQTPAARAVFARFGFTLPGEAAR